MKICISSSGPSENSQVSPVFGRCPYFVVFDEEQERFGTVKNQAWQASRGAGIAAAQKVSDLRCQVLITGNIGPNAFYALNTGRVKIFGGGFGKTIKEVLKDFKEGKLTEAKVPTGRFGRGMRGGFGRGRGGGRGQV